MPGQWPRSGASDPRHRAQLRPLITRPGAGAPEGAFCVRDSESAVRVNAADAISPFTLAYNCGRVVRKSKIMLDPGTGEVWFANCSAVRVRHRGAPHYSAPRP